MSAIETLYEDCKTLTEEQLQDALSHAKMLLSTADSLPFDETAKKILKEHFERAVEVVEIEILNRTQTTQQNGDITNVQRNSSR